LERGQNAHIKCPQCCERYIVKCELRLPDRKEDIDHVGETVVQCVGKTGQRECPPGTGRSLHGCGVRGHAIFLFGLRFFGGIISAPFDLLSTKTLSDDSSTAT
jgi:hypothetical protein